MKLKPNPSLTKPYLCPQPRNKNEKTSIKMVAFHFESDFTLEDTAPFSDWVASMIRSENYHLGELNYIFCTDAYLLALNRKHLNHDTYTDVITFDYVEDKTVSGDIFISTDRVKENAQTYEVAFQNELLRVMSHGLLHLMGYGDKSETQRNQMRKKEDEKIKMFHVEH